MKQAHLKYDEKSQILSLEGLSDLDKRNPMLKAFLRQNLQGDITDNTLILEVAFEDLSRYYQSLNKLLARFKIEVTVDNHMSDELQDVERRELEFLNFSKEAESIWNSNIDEFKFQKFVDSVSQQCPGRVFYRKQLLSAYHLAYSQNACNFSVPGAGKTSVVYAAYAYLKQLPKDDPKSVQRLLVVGPLSSFKAWENEFEEIFNAKVNSFRISGATDISERKNHLKGISINSSSVELTLTSYATLANSEELFEKFLSKSSQKTMLVLDEAHYIKREDGFWSSAALRLAQYANARVVLTGTPAPNGYEDLFNLFAFLYPNKNIIGFPQASLKAMTDGSMDQAIPKLKSKIKPFYTRIKKADLDLPPHTEILTDVPMSKTHNEIYRKLERQIVPSLSYEERSSNSNVRVRARLIRLRQACVNPLLLLKPLKDECLFDTGEDDYLNHAELGLTDLIRDFSTVNDLHRITHCEKLVDKILYTQGKVLIWSYFLGNVALLERVLRHKADFVEVLTGGVSVSGQDGDEYDFGSREDIIDRFHNKSQSSILIANPQAVGESISLHKACRSAIYFDRDFNAGRFIQSKDRIHRYNPNGGLPVSYYYLNSVGTIDEPIAVRLKQKEERLADLVDSEDIPLFSALEDSENASDLRAIVEAYERRKTS